MKHIWKSALALLLALGMTAGAFGCGSRKTQKRKAHRKAQRRKVPQRSRHSR